jgi:hypothetical protein
MSIAHSIENWIYRVANPVVKLLLRSPLHGIASGNGAISALSPATPRSTASGFWV